MRKRNLTILSLTLIGGLLALFTNASSPFDEETSGFGVTIKNQTAAAQDGIADCLRINDQKNGFSHRTDTKTFRKGSYFVKSFPNVPKSTDYSLKYSRRAPNWKEADGGRCQTDFSPAISGDGVFSARIFIQNEVRHSDGVFTAAIVPERSTEARELDLFAVNILNAGRRFVKFGNPGHSASVELTKVIGRWINIVMVKKSELCTVKVTTDGGGVLFSHPPFTCHLGDRDGSGRILLNARAARYSGSDKPSFINISSLQWVRTN